MEYRRWGITYLVKTYLYPLSTYAVVGMRFITLLSGYSGTGLRTTGVVYAIKQLLYRN